MESRPLSDILDSIRTSVTFFGAELVLVTGILVLVISGLILKRKPGSGHFLAFVFIILSGIVEVIQLNHPTQVIFSGMLRTGNSFADYFKILFSLSGILTVAMTWHSEKVQQRLTEYYALILTVILGANILVMSEHLLILFLALEMISLSSYALTGFAFEKKASEGSLKYFLFGSISSAVMLYGFSIIYGIFGTLSFSEFQLSGPDSIALFYIAGTFCLAGFLFKIAAAPMHPWAPDVYEAAPMPIVAFFSVVPKIAGVVILFKFVLYSIPAGINWQLVISGAGILTLTVGNFSALWQKNVKRLMAYSSIAQSGFLLVSVASCSLAGAEALVFYATVYVLLTFLLFIYLQYFENRSFTTIAAYEGSGSSFPWPSFFMLVGFIGLTGLPPTAGFTGKLFLFSALWETYAATGSQILLWFFIFGLLNTVVSLFYYLRIPYYAFIRPQQKRTPAKNLTFENLLGLILVLLVLILFFSPQLLMGWINKSNFVF